MRHENIVTSGGYYVAILIRLEAWRHLAHLAPDQPHG